MDEKYNSPKETRGKEMRDFVLHTKKEISPSDFNIIEHMEALVLVWYTIVSKSKWGSTGSKFAKCSFIKLLIKNTQHI